MSKPTTNSQLLTTNLKVAIVHDWFVGGGAERVVEQLHQMYPDAPIYTSYCSAEWRERLDGKVVTGFLQNWPFNKLRKFLPILRIWWFGRLNFDGFDLVISSSGAEAKGIYVGPRPSFWLRFMHLVGAGGTDENGKGAVQKSTATADRSLQQSDTAERPGGVVGSADKQARPVHISYCHAPTHYYWSRYDEYLANPGFGRLDPVARFGLKILVGPLRRWDYKAAQRPDFMIANSNYIKDQIQKYYGREAIVIHPPVDVERFAGKADEPRRGFVTAGRQTPYKKIDLAVAACTQADVPLVVIGNGPDNRKLRRMAGRNVTFLRKVDDEKLVHYFQTALGFIFPGVDDFGIVAVEAMAAGTPVIAYGQGGALDYVTNETGVLFKQQTIESLVKAIESFKPENFKPEALQKKAAEFSAANFRKNMSEFVKSKMKG